MLRVTQLVRVEPGILWGLVAPEPTLLPLLWGTRRFFPAYPPEVYKSRIQLQSAHMPRCIERSLLRGVCVSVCLSFGRVVCGRVPSRTPCWGHLSSQAEISMACKQPCGQTYVSTTSSPNSVVESGPKPSPGISLFWLRPPWESQQPRGRVSRTGAAPLLPSPVCELAQVQR